MSIQKGVDVRLVERLLVTTGASHSDSTGFLSRGLAARYSRSDSPLGYGNVIEILTGEDKGNKYCVRACDYKSMDSRQEFKVHKVEGNLVTVKFRRRNLTLPKESFEII